MKILFFDTETTGLPKNWNAPIEQLDNWPRLVQIAWQVYNSNGDLLEEHEYIIKPIKFQIPSDATEIHKISTEKALKVGVDLSTILKIFTNSIRGCELLVAHNYNFDYSIIGSELLRNGIENNLKLKAHICTMNKTIFFCNILDSDGLFKWPKLEELYYILFKESFNTHNALDDIRATAKCFWKLLKLKEITIPEKTNIDNDEIVLQMIYQEKDQLNFIETTSAQNISATLIINKIIDFKKYSLEHLKSLNSHFKISSAGEVELMIYFFYYIMHALLNTKKTSLKNKGGYIDYLLAPNRARKGYKAIKLNDRIIVVMLAYLKNLIICENIKLGIKNNDVNNFITQRFTLYKYCDEYYYNLSGQSGPQVVRVNKDLITAVYHNPLKNKVLASGSWNENTGFGYGNRHVKLEKDSITKDERFNMSNCGHIDEFFSLLDYCDLWEKSVFKEMKYLSSQSIIVEDYID